MTTFIHSYDISNKQQVHLLLKENNKAIFASFQKQYPSVNVAINKLFFYNYIFHVYLGIFSGQDLKQDIAMKKDIAVKDIKTHGIQPFWSLMAELQLKNLLLTSSSRVDRVNWPAFADASAAVATAPAAPMSLTTLPSSSSSSSSSSISSSSPNVRKQMFACSPEMIGFKVDPEKGGLNHNLIHDLCHLKSSSFLRTNQIIAMQLLFELDEFVQCMERDRLSVALLFYFLLQRIVLIRLRLKDGKLADKLTDEYLKPADGYGDLTVDYSTVVEFIWNKVKNKKVCVAVDAWNVMNSFSLPESKESTKSKAAKVTTTQKQPKMTNNYYLCREFVNKMMKRRVLGNLRSQMPIWHGGHVWNIDNKDEYFSKVKMEQKQQTSKKEGEGEGEGKSRSQFTTSSSSSSSSSSALSPMLISAPAPPTRKSTSLLTQLTQPKIQLGNEIALLEDIRKYWLNVGNSIFLPETLQEEASKEEKQKQNQKPKQGKEEKQKNSSQKNNSNSANNKGTGYDKGTGYGEWLQYFKPLEILDDNEISKGMFKDSESEKEKEKEKDLEALMKFQGEQYKHLWPTRQQWREIVNNQLVVGFLDFHRALQPNTNLTSEYINNNQKYPLNYPPELCCYLLYLRFYYHKYVYHQYHETILNHILNALKIKITSPTSPTSGPTSGTPAMSATKIPKDLLFLTEASPMSSPMSTSIPPSSIPTSIPTTIAIATSVQTSMPINFNLSVVNLMFLLKQQVTRQLVTFKSSCLSYRQAKTELCREYSQQSQFDKEKMTENEEKITELDKAISEIEADLRLDLSFLEEEEEKHKEEQMLLLDAKTKEKNTIVGQQDVLLEKRLLSILDFKKKLKHLESDELVAYKQNNYFLCDVIVKLFF